MIIEFVILLFTISEFEIFELVTSVPVILEEVTFESYIVALSAELPSTLEFIIEQYVVDESMTVDESIITQFSTLEDEKFELVTEVLVILEDVILDKVIVELIVLLSVLVVSFIWEFWSVEPEHTKFTKVSVVRLQLLIVELITVTLLGRVEFVTVESIIVQ